MQACKKIVGEAVRINPTCAQADRNAVHYQIEGKEEEKIKRKDGLFQARTLSI